ncbi:MAG: ABC transporter substrate-binding protein [Pseudorhodobacter sp.]|nr:ABC transporter substrate-binding protein [Pseudorhodobacter sp.]
MRHLVIAAALNLLAALWPSAAPAYEVEAQRTFGSGATWLSVLSTTDTENFAPVIEGFLARRPDLALRYVMASSTEVFAAVHDEAAPFDLVISSAMDLQMKLGNDGFAAPFASDAVDALPAWARWRDRIFGFALEPVVVLASRQGLHGLPSPRTRRDLIDLLRDHPERFDGRIATYDPRVSGAGYLFATQDARQSDTFWRLAEVMGRLNARLYCCSGEMIRDLESGRMLLAYNVVGSYAARGRSADDSLIIIELEDFTVTLLRTAFVPKTAARPDLGGEFLDYLLGPEGQRLILGDSGFPRIGHNAIALKPHIRPIRLDPGLLVYLDTIKRRNFLAEWNAAMTQP